ncbi:DNA excision repair protein ERCC-5 [Fusarium tjaetaba]|uniref:DNA excision repair protein ERCC-5 n=1 Tax=Fusarium tjaetaba TaxID=1567544 RepID=A0A8H5QP66_9HYPO|nr:DNA excision repair protein ERCC-5 [Fusarium tjaetaba]KAF5617903.1 DNA excision repair protein ERCC-5 [Fusarium tjaetaba]
MGVTGLWTVVQPCARPTNLATLNRKRLAVDASIWIYQFLKAVRDKEGNALRNSHVVGFFRRICKLLWFGIQPVFVFDGGAPILKRQTIQHRKRRREGRREDAVRTAGKLLAVQMQRIAEEDHDRRRRDRERDISAREEQQQEVIPDASQLVYDDEALLSQNERQKGRTFRKQDAYHLPDLDGGGIAAMGKPDDPRIMSVEELEEYARQFQDGEDINLYDFSKIDFDGEFFKSLPAPDRYNILNAARLRSRLRMGLSKEQLEEMFPDRMAFSKFQIERVKERNHLTQRLMYEVGMTGTDLTLGVNARVAGEKNREYILVKNEGAEGGWALGVVSRDKDVGEAHKPIDVDAIQVQYQSKEDEEEEEEDFEDVPIEGLNRLPKPTAAQVTSYQAAQDIAARRRQIYGNYRQESSPQGEDSLFVGGNIGNTDVLFERPPEEALHNDEEDDLNRAIAMSLQNQHGVGKESDHEEEFEDIPMEAPKWTQKSVDAQKPITAKGGSMIAHIVNNRASAAVPRRQEHDTAADSDSDEDMQTVLAKARMKKKPQPKTKFVPVVENKKNPFDGPLPFQKLDWGSSLFGKKKAPEAEPNKKSDVEGENSTVLNDEEDDMAGGFERELQDENAPRPLPPWLTDDTDIRESLKKQQETEREINNADRQAAEEEERLYRRKMQDQLIHIDSSSDDDSDVEVLDKPPSPKKPAQKEPNTIDAEDETEKINEASLRTEKPELTKQVSTSAYEREDALEQVVEKAKEPSPEAEAQDLADRTVEEPTAHSGHEDEDKSRKSESPEPEFEDVVPIDAVTTAEKSPASIFEEIPFIGAPAVGGNQELDIDDDGLFDDVEYDEFSDPGDEELMAQMAEEAEEHARFASELNNKTAEQNKEDYERELRALRNQQKKDRRDADEVTQVMITECQALLRLFGIPYITAPMEAEAQCAELVRLGLVDGIVTDDSDTFLFGGTRVYKNMFNSNKFVECYLVGDIEKELSLSREQLISLAHLLGSDYTEGLPGVGPVTAVEILSEFPGKSGLEDFREWWRSVQSQTRPKDADVSTPFRKKFRKSQGTKLFLPPGFPNPAVYDAYLHPEVDDSNENFQWGVPDVEGLRQFLMATIGWSKERTDEVLVPVIKDMNKRDREGTQSNITRFFGSSVGVGAKEAFAPRQKAQGSKRMAAAVDRLRANVTGEEARGVESGGKRKRASRRNAAAPVDEGQYTEEAGDEVDDERTSRSRGKGKRVRAS